jgi:hypothetical protein
LASKFGEFSELAEIVPFVFQTSTGKFNSDLYFEGGRLEIAEETFEEWRSLGRA